MCSRLPRKEGTRQESLELDAADHPRLESGLTAHANVRPEHSTIATFLSLLLLSFFGEAVASGYGPKASRRRRRRNCKPASALITSYATSKLTASKIPGQWITHFHTFSAYAAFLGALIVGMSLHYTKIVQNEHFGYPVEWFPSVSATIGDRYPERLSLIHI